MPPVSARRSRSRVVFRVAPLKHSPRWRITRGRFIVTTARYQTGAVSFAVALAKRLRAASGALTQVVLHGRNGRVRWERTYGRDPRRHVG